MVILNEPNRQAMSLELVCSECFHEKPAAVLKNVRHQDDDILQVPRFNSYVHCPS